MGETIVFLTGGTAADRNFIMEKHLLSTGLFKAPKYALFARQPFEYNRAHRNHLEPEEHIPGNLYYVGEDYLQNEEFLTKIKVRGKDLLSLLSSLPARNTSHIMPNAEYLKGMAYSEFQFYYPHFDKCSAPFFGHIVYNAEQPEVEIPQMMSGLSRHSLDYRCLEVNVLGANIVSFHRQNLLTIKPTIIDPRTHALQLPTNCIVRPVDERPQPNPNHSFTLRHPVEEDHRRQALIAKVK